MNWLIKLKLHKILVFFLVAFVALEFFSFVLVSTNMLLFNETPKLYRKQPKDVSTVSSNWWTERDLWGAWHKKNAVARHVESCFSVEYQSNSDGARDEEFSGKTSDSTFVLLGDSFAEGFGVDFDKTAHRLIESITGTKLLNFGTAGDFGPLQYWLIYENLAKKYPHDGLVIFFLPANDFTDNDYDFWKGTQFTELTRTERYRPYYKRMNSAEYEYFIPPNSIPRDTLSTLNKVEFALLDNFWSVNVLRTIKKIVFAQQAQVKPPSYSGYFNPTLAQQEAAIYFIEKIISTTPAKKVLVVSIPTQADFDFFAKGAKREGMHWWTSFKNLERLPGKDIRFLDLIDHPVENPQSLFLSCDSHWSAFGNQWAAETISHQLARP